MLALNSCARPARGVATLTTPRRSIVARRFIPHASLDAALPKPVLDIKLDSDGPATLVDAPTPAGFTIPEWLRKCGAIVGVVLLGLVLMFGAPNAAEAARSGGRAGGSSFGGARSSSYSSSRSYSSSSSGSSSRTSAFSSSSRSSYSAPSRSSSSRSSALAPGSGMGSSSSSSSSRSYGSMGGSFFGSSKRRSSAVTSERPAASAPSSRSGMSSGMGYSGPSSFSRSPAPSRGPSVIVTPAPPSFGFGYPMFGYGVPVVSTGPSVGSSLFSLIVLAIFGYVLIQTISSSFGGSEDYEEEDIDSAPMSIVKLQVGLLGSARDLQRDLNRMAMNTDTSTPQGLHYLLQETVLALRRNPQYAVYGKAMLTKTRGLDNAEAKFNQTSMEERGKFESETLSNFGGRTTRATSQSRGDGLNELIVVTIIAAVDGKLEPVDVQNIEDLKEDLNLLGSIPSNRLLALEVLWTPQDDNDFFTRDQLIEDYPLMNSL